jgi:Fic family protein
MWRMNWVHPFYGGNGRTARAISYLALCVRLGFILPGEKTIPELIAEDKAPYYAALRSADSAWDSGKLDVSEMETLVARLLAAQLVQVHEKATGKKAILE